MAITVGYNHGYNLGVIGFIAIVTSHCWNHLRNQVVVLHVELHRSGTISACEKAVEWQHALLLLSQARAEGLVLGACVQRLIRVSYNSVGLRWVKYEDWY